MTPAEIEDDLRHAPARVSWSDVLPPLPTLARRLKVAIPCCGIDGCGHALSEMGVSADMTNVYDVIGGYTKVLEKHMREAGQNIIKLNLGPIHGDLTKVNADDLDVPVDILCSGPPCPPWSTTGKRHSRNDIRAKVFFQVLQWALWLIQYGGLIAVVLENVAGMTHAISGLAFEKDGARSPPPTKKMLPREIVVPPKMENQFPCLNPGGCPTMAPAPPPHLALPGKLLVDPMQARQRPLWECNVLQWD